MKKKVSEEGGGEAEQEDVQIAGLSFSAGSVSSCSVYGVGSSAAFQTGLTSRGVGTLPAGV